ncbi:MAG: DUF6502 family protein, partial [Woeseiaceae bacterium]
MENKTQQKIRSAIYLVLRPLARTLLRGGVGFREFAEIAKRAFVDVATKDYGLRGRPTNISRVAVMTGLTRKEVRRLRELDNDSSENLVARETPIAQVLHRWHTDNEFLSQNGEPKSLSPNGEVGSFASLVKKYGGDVPPGAMRTELERIDAIEILDDDRLRPKKRIAYNIELNDRIVGGLTNILYPAALNLAHNVQLEDQKHWWSNLVAYSKHIKSSDRGRYMRISSDRIEEFAKSIDDMQAGY